MSHPSMHQLIRSKATNVTSAIFRSLKTNCTNSQQLTRDQRITSISYLETTKGRQCLRLDEEKLDNNDDPQRTAKTLDGLSIGTAQIQRKNIYLTCILILLAVICTLSIFIAYSINDAKGNMLVEQQYMNDTNDEGGYNQHKIDKQGTNSTTPTLTKTGSTVTNADGDAHHEQAHESIINKDETNFVNITTTFPTEVETTTKSTLASTTKNPSVTTISTQIPTQLPTVNPTSHYSLAPSSQFDLKDVSQPPSKSPTKLPTQNPTHDPTQRPTLSPLVSPTQLPTQIPTSSPTASPTRNPTYTPTQHPTVVSTSEQPSSSPSVAYIPGELSISDAILGLHLSTGLSVRVLGRAGHLVKYDSYNDGITAEIMQDEKDIPDSLLSGRVFHGMLDGATVIPLASSPSSSNINGTSASYVYVSNSELDSNNGGVYGLYFDEHGNLLEYKALLTRTKRNCSGGKTPWNTWISCEEFSKGQCWQVDPNPYSMYHNSPAKTTLGGDGGKLEAVACDNTNPDKPIFFVTEDHSYGALRRVVINGNGWESLHDEDAIESVTYLRMRRNNAFEWVTNKYKGELSANKYFPNAEGIHYRDGHLYFVSKTNQAMFILDLENKTYKVEDTGAGRLIRDGGFVDTPDQLAWIDNNYSGEGVSGKYLYFTEDGGFSPGVYARDANGTYYTIFQAFDEKYKNDEAVGLAFSPDGTKMYAGLQDCGCYYSGGFDCGCLFEFSRQDGLPFEGNTMNLKYHASEKHRL